jgi:lysophospholipase L1-like esterase
MNQSTAPRALVALATLALVAPVFSRPAAAVPIKPDYIALGDSLAFGETTFQFNPSNGDRGYAALYDQYLATQNLGVKPTLINLGVDGETSSTFFSGGTPGPGTPGNPAPQWNTNYPNPPVSQNALLLSTIASEQAAGHAINTISIQLGANDLYQLVTNPTFFALTPAQQQTQVANVLATVQANDTTLLTELHSLIPKANVLLMGYYNPFNAFPNSPIGQVADPAIKGLNAVIAGEAAAFGAHYVDTYSPFVGNELKYTYMNKGNVHPDDLGYKAIAIQMETVPEPTSLLVMAAGVGFAALARRRRQAPV